MLTIALIGLGRIAEHHIRAIGEIEDLELVAGCDVNANTRKALPADVPFFQDHRELLARCGANIFVVATPPATHHAIAGDVLSAGRGLMLEKPMTASLEELEDLRRRHEAAGRSPFFHVALHAAHGLDVRWWLRQRHGHRNFGPITGFHAFRYDPNIPDTRHERAGHRAIAERIGPWVESGINALSAVGAFIPPERMRIASSRMIGRGLVKGCAEVAGSASIAFTPVDGGLNLGSIDVDWTQGVNRKGCTLCYGGSSILVHLDDSGQAVRVTRNGEEILRSPPLGGTLPRLTNQYVGVYRELLRCFHSGRSNLDHALTLHRLLFEAWSRPPAVWTPSL